MKKLILTIIISIFLISLVGAIEESIGTFKQEECVNLIQTCSNCTYNNISRVLYPDSTLALSNVAMTKDDTYYNYTFCNTSIFGAYIVNGFGDLNGDKTVWAYNFEITADGQEPLTFPYQFIIIIFAILFIIIGLVKERFRLFQFTGSILMMIMGILTLYPGYSFINWTTLTGLALGTILIGIGFYFLLEPAFSRDEQEEYFEQRGGE